ncbi:unnamed protein product [Menidia menidia]|uniref:(Atlantic silverside) hypothetical protein n=1 Tax=Menidia menidia TaxID=238744 RepID=A0A8S4AJM6_9TELE|nr:unnamed protein product [Menidia menidia]
MASSFSKELEDLLNPLPTFHDPEDDTGDVTAARLIEDFNENEEEAGISVLRKQNISLLSDRDGRYVGNPVSRTKLLMDFEASGEDSYDEMEGGDGEVEEEGEIEDDEDDSVIDEEIDEDVSENSSEDEGENKLPGSNSELVKKKVSKIKSADITLDFPKLTKSMNHLEMNREDDDDNEEISDESECSEEDEDSSGGETEGGEEDMAGCTFLKDETNEEIEKGKAVKNQLALYDQLLEGRIKIQKALVTANQLPQPDTVPEFKRMGGAELAGVLKNTHKALTTLQRSLFELQDDLLFQNADTQTIALGKTQAQSGDEEMSNDEDKKDASVPASLMLKRKLEMVEYPDLMAKRFAAFQPYCGTTLKRWHDKTRLTVGKTSKGFQAFESNIVTQVEQVLMDKERLLRRTQTRRSDYRVLGKRDSSNVMSENAPSDGQLAQLKANTHLKDLDEDIYDDDDFYHHLLRELIEQKTSTADPKSQTAMGKHWLAIHKLRRKIKKNVDTKASKGRKVRYHIHSKLVNFMAPVDQSSVSDEACNDLYRALFDQKASVKQGF